LSLFSNMAGYNVGKTFKKLGQKLARNIEKDKEG
jgi:hypothetical protein